MLNRYSHIHTYIISHTHITLCISHTCTDTHVTWTYTYLTHMHIHACIYTHTKKKLYSFAPPSFLISYNIGHLTWKLMAAESALEPSYSPSNLLSAPEVGTPLPVLRSESVGAVLSNMLGISQQRIEGKAHILQPAFHYWRNTALLFYSHRHS